MVVVEWTEWGHIVDSAFGGGQCLNGYGIEFYMSRIEGATPELIKLETDTDPYFTHDIPSKNVNPELQVFDNPPGAVIFRQTNDLNMVGPWHIYYRLFLYKTSCEEDDDGNCIYQCLPSLPRCNSNCEKYCNEDCSAKEFYEGYCSSSYWTAKMKPAEKLEETLSPISEEFMTLRVIPDCSNQFYNNFEINQNAVFEIEYVVGSGQKNITHPLTATFQNTWDYGCGDIQAKLVQYDKTLVSISKDESMIFIDSYDINMINKTSEMYFEASLVWDPTQILPDPFLITINFVEFATVVEEQVEEEEIILTIDKVLGKEWNDPTFELAGSKPSFVFDLS